MRSCSGPCSSVFLLPALQSNLTLFFSLQQLLHLRVPLLSFWAKESETFSRIILCLCSEVGLRQIGNYKTFLQMPHAKHQKLYAIFQTMTKI